MATLGQAGRVGAMVLVSVVILILMFTFFSGGLFRHVYTLDVLFNDASGATKDASVTLAGVQIGTVRQITLTPFQKADLTLEIKDSNPIPRGSKFSIVTPILGSTGQVVVTPPPDAAKRPSDMIPPGASNLVGERALDFSSAFTQANSVLIQLAETTRRSDKLIDALTQTTLNANSAISGPQVQRSLNNLGEASGNLNRASANGLRLTQQLNSVLVQDNAEVTSLLRQTRKGSQAALGNIGATTAQLKGLAAENRGKLNDIVSDLQATTASISAITSQVHDDLTNGGVAKNLDAIVGNLKAASDKLVVISDNFEKLSSDQGLQGDLRGTLHNIRSSSEQTAYLLERLNQLAGTRAHPAVVVAPGTGPVIVAPGSPNNLPPGGSPPTRTDSGLAAPLMLPRYDLVQDLRTEHFRTDLDAIVPIRGRAPGMFGRAGVYGFGDTNQVIAQIGAALDPRGLFDGRIGLYASKLSVGGDIGLGRRATLSLDAWDPNRYHLDARGVMMLSDQLGLIVGAEDIGRRTSPTLGLEYRR